MKKFTCFAVAVAGLLLLPIHAWSIGHAAVVNPPKAGPKVVVVPHPVVVNRTPAPAGNVVKIPPIAKVVVQPTKVVTNINQKFPPTPVHVEQKVFVENNQHKFVGVGQKGFVVKQYVKVEPPQIKYKPPAMGYHPVVQTFHDKYKVANVKSRPEFVVNYQKHWSERMDHRYERAHEIRTYVGTTYHHLFTPDWWGHYHGVHSGWWGRYPQFAARWFAFKSWEWWRPAPWETITAWCYGPGAWAPPFYYDYGGNVIFENNVVYLEDHPCAMQKDFANQAIDLANSGAIQLDKAPPAPDDIQNQWLPLGTFAVANEDKGDPTQFIQLAVNKQGVIAGSFHNASTDEAQPITGAIDPKTQRAAWYIGDNKSTVMETGVYNLTAPETQVLVHFGNNQTQTWMLVRMQEPDKK